MGGGGGDNGFAASSYQQQMQALAQQQAALREQEARVVQQQRQVEAQFLAEQERARQMELMRQKQLQEEAERARQLEMMRQHQEMTRQKEEAERRRREELARQEMMRLEALRQEAMRQEAMRQEAIRQEAIRQEALRHEAIRREQQARQEALRQEALRQEALRREEQARQEAARQEALRQQELARQEAMRQEAIRQEALRQEAIRQERARLEAEQKMREEQARLQYEAAMRAEAQRQYEANVRAEAQRQLELQEAMRQQELLAEEQRREAVRQQVLEQERIRQLERLRMEEQQRLLAEQQRRQQEAMELQRQEALRQEAQRQEAERVAMQQVLLAEAQRQQQQLIEEARAREEFERNQQLIAENQARLEAERRELEKKQEQMTALTPEQRKDVEVLEMQGKLTAEQQQEIQSLVAAVVSGQELSAEQQGVLRQCLTSAQLEEVRLQMLANLAEQQQHQQSHQAQEEEERLRKQVEEAAAKSAELKAEMKKHEQDMKAHFEQSNAAKDVGPAPSFPSSFDMSVVNPFEALPAPRKSRKNNSAAPASPGPAAAVVTAAAPAAVSLPQQQPTEWKAQFSSVPPPSAPSPPKSSEGPKIAPLSGGISAEERKRQIEAEVRKKIEGETRAKIEAEKKRIEEDVRRKIEAEARGKVAAKAAVAIAPKSPFDEDVVVVEEIPAPKRLVAPPAASPPPPPPPRDDYLIQSTPSATPPPPPSRPAPPPPAAELVVNRTPPPLPPAASAVSYQSAAYQNPFEDTAEAPVADGGRSIVTISGWLHKKGAIVKSYKRRWMVLRGNTLQWYESERQPSPQGSMELVLGEHIVVDTPGDVKFEIHPKEAKERSYFFKAESSSDKKRWLAALQEVLEVGEAVVAPAEEREPEAVTTALPPVPPRQFGVEPPAPPVPVGVLNAEHRKLASTLSSLSGLGLGDDDDEEDEQQQQQHEEEQQHTDHHHQEQHAQAPSSSQFAFVSKVRLGPPLPEDLKRSQDLATLDWFEDRAKLAERGFARSVYQQDRAAIPSIDFSRVSPEERDTWRFLVLNTMLMEKEQLSCDLAVLRTLWLPVFGGGVKKSKIKTLVRDPIFAQLDDQVQELFDRHKNLAVQLAQLRNAFFETRTFGEMVLKLANYAAKIDILFVEAFPAYVAAYTYHAQTNAKFAKFIEKQKANVDLVGRGFVESLRMVIDHLDRFNTMYNDILECTDPAHPDYGQTQKAVFVVLTLTERIANIDVTCQQHLDIGILDGQFDPPQKGFNVYDRRLLKRSKCSFFVKEKRRVEQKTCDALLCNDVLVIVEEAPGKNPGQVRLVVHALVDLRSVVSVRATKEELVQLFKEMEQTQVEMAALAIGLMLKKDKKELFFLDSVDQKEALLAELEAILGKLKTEQRMKNIQ